MSDHATCTVCEKQIADGEDWIFLNRYLVGNGVARAAIEAVDDRGEYAWDMEREENGEPVPAVSGYPLHWPACAHVYIESDLASCRVESRKRGWDG